MFMSTSIISVAIISNLFRILDTAESFTQADDAVHLDVVNIYVRFV